MERGEALARSALRWDAGYCVIMGAAAAVFFSPIAAALEAPKALIAIAGLAVASWGGLVGRMSLGAPWRRVTVLVVLANLAGTAGLAGLALLADIDTAGRVIVLGVALQVFGFAATQAHALWSPWRR